MIEGFLLAYASFTAPIFIWAVWRVRKEKDHSKPFVYANSDNELKKLEKALKESFGDKIKIHEVPKKALLDSIDSSVLLSDLLESEQHVTAWLTSIRDKVDINKRDMDAMLQASKAIAGGVLDIKKSLEQPAKRARNKESFINELRYAGEKFAKTPTQKKTIDLIINNVKEAYGTE